MGQRPFRFGATVFRVRSRDEWIAHARQAEERGYATFLVPDHFSRDLLAPMPALMAAADATSTLRVGSLVFANDFRHPALLASEAATVDLLSNGRFELGIGAGWMQQDYGPTGIVFDPPAVRVERLAEAVTIIKRLFGDEPVSFAGRHYNLDGLHGAPKPVQQPGPPILIAGSGRRMLSLAAREANTVGLLVGSNGVQLDLASGSAAETERRVRWVREAAGERFGSLELNTLILQAVVTDRRSQVAAELARQWGVSGEQLLDTTHFLIGSVDQIVDDLQTWRERFGISYIVVNHAEGVAALAPVVARLAGR